MVLHKTWYTIAISLLVALFIISSVAVFISPKTMIPSLVSGSLGVEIALIYVGNRSLQQMIG